jgi:hypothetical protein
MSDEPSYEWEPDPITRLHALAAALPGAIVAARPVNASFERVWSVLSDLERSVPLYEPQVDRLHIVSRRGQHLELTVDLIRGQRLDVQARLNDGWCLMQSDESVVAMAARPFGRRTLVGHLEYARGPHGRSQRADARQQRDKLLQEIGVIERLATRAADSPPSIT